MSVYLNSPISTKFQQFISEDCFNIVEQTIEFSYQKISSILDQILLDCEPYSFKFIDLQSHQQTLNFIIIKFFYKIPTFKPTKLTSTNLIISREVNKKEQIMRSENMMCSQESDQLIEERRREQIQYLGIIKQNDEEFHFFNNQKNFSENKIEKIKRERSPQPLSQLITIHINNYNGVMLVLQINNIHLLQQQVKMTLKGNLELLQICQNKNQVYTLNFMKNSNNFVSGFIDNSIIIWKENAHNQWNCEQILNGHQGQILCLLLNNNDYLIISASLDKTIKFWMKQNEWICQQTITDHTNSVSSISLNEQCNKLISCSIDQQILVIERSQLDSYWNVKQKIKVDKCGIRLCFINDMLFKFQPIAQDSMHVYEMDRITKQYSRTSEIAVKSGSNRCDSFFSQFYAKSKCLLLNKNGNIVNLMQKNGRFVVEQSNLIQ
ncbi:unnamed protein product [Paramecium octaurelia]|uniref:WD domain, G-beta repeat protein n=1 Tax=Paramecium octaurelia TaxID=43137 RepID=A0A8S1TR60_PAROT|nr:unnamed protein product [Paramecium octaurelia]